MKTIRVLEPGGPEVMQWVDAPTPRAGPGQVLIKVAAAGVNFLDIYHRSGQYPMALPLALGREGAGLVEALGDGVESLAVGERVAWAGVTGSYATHVVADPKALVPVPKELSLEQGAAAMLQGMTAHYLACSTFPLGPDHTAVVHAAAGGVGRLLCQIARRRGARVIGLVSTEEKAAVARAAGANEVLVGEPAFAAQVKRLTSGRGANVVYDSVGKDTFDQSMDSLCARGLVALFGQSSGAVPPLDLQTLNAKGSLYVTRPSLHHYTATREELLARAGEVLGWIADGSLKLHVGRTYPLAEAAQAHRDLAGRKTTGKLLLIP